MLLENIPAGEYCADTLTTSSVPVPLLEEVCLVPDCVPLFLSVLPLHTEPARIKS